MKKKNEAAQTLGKLGGEARARNLTPEARKAAASFAAKKRWANRDAGTHDELIRKSEDAGLTSEETKQKLESADGGEIKTENEI